MKKRKIVALVCVAAVLLLAVSAFGYVQSKLDKINKVPDTVDVIPPDQEDFETDASNEPKDIIELKPEEVDWSEIEPFLDDDLLNILLVGQDRREGEGRQRSDSMILCSINPDTKQISMISFLRDLYVQIPGGYSDNRLNRNYLNDPRPENMPILGDLYDELRKQDEKEAQYIATALEIYVTGSLNVFNHQTNVDVHSRVVAYDIKELGKQLKKIGMLIVQDQVWNRVTVNREAHKSTRYYIDEMHLLLKEEQTASYTIEIWKRFRKWGGMPTGITQNVKDLLSSREVENIFENSDYIYMLNQASGDRQILAKQLNISPHQLSYVTHSGEGEGLLFYGNIILPFVDRFPKDTELYRVLTTKPQEVSS